MHGYGGVTLSLWAAMATEKSPEKTQKNMHGTHFEMSANDGCGDAHGGVGICPPNKSECNDRVPNRLVSLWSEEEPPQKRARLHHILNCLALRARLGEDPLSPPLLATASEELDELISEELLIQQSRRLPDSERKAIFS